MGINHREEDRVPDTQRKAHPGRERESEAGTWALERVTPERVPGDPKRCTRWALVGRGGDRSIFLFNLSRLFWKKESQGRK